MILAHPLRSLIRPPVLARPFSATLAARMKVIPSPCATTTTRTSLSTPPPARPRGRSVRRPKVQAAAEEAGVQIVPTYHPHHYDHSGGNKASAFPDAPVYGGSNQIPALTQLVKDKDVFKVGEGISVRIDLLLCTSSSSSHPGGVFTGDTLFVAGCGRFFEGTGEEMDRALTYLGTLPDQTVVYNGHEYTSGNVAFAKSVDGDNAALKRLAQIVEENKIVTGLTTIGDEKEWNPFMRLQSAPVQ
ncbi:beta-lactamase-like protein [Fomitopsis serialis]|uniref:beta-lactamase-like protein n=1 Tax=Fomitopsis serialis TaxID=139415 RepID=UPI002008C90E|nr:beta-lactamase-like protein [Neoantrodia serialis]KAH9934829.1 beta-lactamase-like protein [Neoantrodia serialis]